jgi:hypothetical protein
MIPEEIRTWERIKRPRKGWKKKRMIKRYKE